MSNFLNQFPYSDFHEMNLDWILKKMKELAAQMDDFTAANQISYADPINWNITKQYQAFTIVYDTASSTLKISKQPVPSGISIDNDTYWAVVSPFKVDTEFDASSINPIANSTVTTEFQNQKASLDNEILSRENADTALTESVQSNASRINDNAAAIESNTADIVALNARVSAIASLEEDSTTGDAELIDIRTAFNGIEYDSAGDAVRAQAEEMIIKPSSKTLMGTITHGKWIKSNGDEYTDSSSALMLSSAVQANHIYYASGMHISNTFPFMIYFDSNNNVLGTETRTGSNVAVNDFQFIPPTGCTRIAINSKDASSDNFVYPMLYSLDPDTSYVGNSIIDSLSNKQSKSLKWDQTDYDYETNKYVMVSNGIVVIKSDSTAKGYNYARLEYDKSKKYRFYGVKRSSVIMAVVCTDENNIIIKKYTSTNNVPLVAQEYNDIPDNTYYIYVNGYSTCTAYIEESGMRDIISFEGDKIGVCFGDSITQGNNVYREFSKPFKDYPSDVSRILDCSIYNGGLGGSTFCGDRSIDLENVIDCVVSGDFSTVLSGISQYNLNGSATLAYNEISQLDFSKVDFITIALGTNDWNFGKTKEQVKEALDYCLSQIITAYPQLRIYIFTPIYRFDIRESGEDADTFVNPTSGLKLHDICDAIIETARSYNIPVLDLYYNCNINKYNKDTYMGDGTHPNANGYAMMADKISKFINSN